MDGIVLPDVPGASVGRSPVRAHISLVRSICRAQTDLGMCKSITAYRRAFNPWAESCANASTVESPMSGLGALVLVPILGCLSTSILPPIVSVSSAD